MRSTQGYALEPIDIFACGTMLFMMYAGHPPFRKASETDRWYKAFSSETPDSFWVYHSSIKEKSYGPGFYSEEFKALCNGLFHANPSKRFTVEQIKESAWYKGEVADESAVVKEFEGYQAELAAYFQADKEGRKQEKLRLIQKAQERFEEPVFTGVKIYRSLDQVKCILGSSFQ